MTSKQARSAAAPHGPHQPSSYWDTLRHPQLHGLVVEVQPPYLTPCTCSKVWAMHMSVCMTAQGQRGTVQVGCPISPDTHRAELCRPMPTKPEQPWPHIITSTCLGHLHLQSHSTNTASTTPQQEPALPRRETEAGERHNLSATPASQHWSPCPLLAPILGALGCSQHDPLHPRGKAALSITVRLAEVESNSSITRQTFNPASSLGGTRQCGTEISPGLSGEGSEPRSEDISLARNTPPPRPQSLLSARCGESL